MFVLYPKGSPLPEDTGRTDWAKVELSVEVKLTDVPDDSSEDISPHYPTDSETRKENLSQIMTYAVIVFNRQQRTHHFTVIIIGSMARLVRWNRSGLVFTEKFDYKREPHKLGKFLWCFTRLSPSQRGHDSTVVPVLPGSDHYNHMRKRAKEPYMIDGVAVGEHARELFQNSLDDDWPWWKLTVHDADRERYFLAGKPNFISTGLAGRGTRGFVAIDLADPDGPFVFLKDTWRIDHPRIRKEGDILSDLNQAKVGHIPTLVCHGDVPGQRTVSQDVWNSIHSGNKENLKRPMTARQHYRIVVKEVGLPLTAFENGKQLISIFMHVLAGELLYCLC